jgi:hypothetical protein
MCFLWTCQSYSRLCFLWTCLSFCSLCCFGNVRSIAACAALGDVPVLWQSVLPWTCLSYTSLSCFGRACPTAAVLPLDVSVLQQTVIPLAVPELPLDAPAAILYICFTAVYVKQLLKDSTAQSAAG